MSRLSERLGAGVRTNSESLLGVTSLRPQTDFSQGVTIGSILHVDENTHLEPVSYPSGSGFFRLLCYGAVQGKTFAQRLFNLIKAHLSDPIGYLKMYFTPDWARYTQILLFMQTLDSTLRFRLGRWGLSTAIDQGQPPTPFIPLAYEMANRFAARTGGKVSAQLVESLGGMASTAHILGGVCMGKDAAEGVIDSRNRLFNYTNAYVCDGSMISANLGVNPSLTITALSERAMSFIEPSEAMKADGKQPWHVGFN